MLNHSTIPALTFRDVTKFSYQIHFNLIVNQISFHYFIHVPKIRKRFLDLFLDLPAYNSQKKEQIYWKTFPLCIKNIYLPNVLDLAIQRVTGVVRVRRL